MSEPKRPIHTNPASCIVATIFLIIVIAVIFTIYIFFYRPKDPTITLNTVELPTFSNSNGTIKFTILQKVSVTNPNRDTFTHYDSSLKLVYSSSQVGFMFLPAGKVNGGQTQHMLAVFAVEPFPLTATSSGVVTALSDGGVGVGAAPTLEMEMRMKLVGRVRVLRFLSHKVDSTTSCSVVIEVKNGSVLGLHC